ncbi:MAG TPA: isoaspartyl peptidase/L-asparaginase [Chloroflexota bacterium]|nr:isoaspartyl peptidase/L-asparaginase [Chloroflexota bacterium]
MARGPIVLVHGGAGAWDAGYLPAVRAGITAALEAGWEQLSSGRTAVDAVEAAVAALEDDETFNAGRGSCLTSDGRVQMDALIMDGATLDAGAVACVERLRNPIRAARALLEHGPHMLFVGPDAERAAEQLGLELCHNAELITERRRLDAAGAAQDTVGAVALDAAGNLACATSTGGMTGKPPGRVGDSPLVGCGGYADNQAGAVSMTGWGESIMRLVLAKWTVDRLLAGVSAGDAARLAIELLKDRARGSGGLIVLDREGRYGAACNTPMMPWGVRNAERTLVEELQGERA